MKLNPFSLPDRRMALAFLCALVSTFAVAQEQPVVAAKKNAKEIATRYTRPIRNETESVLDTQKCENFKLCSVAYRSGDQPVERIGEAKSITKYPKSFHVFRIFDSATDELVREVWSNDIPNLDKLEKETWADGTLGNLRYLITDNSRNSIIVYVSMETSRSATSIGLIEIPVDSSRSIRVIGTCHSDGGKLFDPKLSPDGKMLSVGYLESDVANEGAVLLNLETTNMKLVPENNYRQAAKTRLTLQSVTWGADDSAVIVFKTGDSSRQEYASFRCQP